MKITFVLPAVPTKPVGGYKIVYEYANRLTSRGHDVSLLHAANPFWPSSVATYASSLLSHVRQNLVRATGDIPWFDLHPNVHLITAYRPVGTYVPESDVVVATAWQTANWVASYGPEKGRKYYLIQDFEAWNASKEEVTATWKLPLRKIVIAKWLRETANELGEGVTYIPNALDFDEFGVDVPIRRRSDQAVLMLHHPSPHKGTRDGLAALDIARTRFPNLQGTLFGVTPRPTDLPSWLSYVQNPPRDALRQLYNAASIFVAPSRREGWGLTACEAMMCGASVAATDIGGHREYAIHEVTALLSPSSSPKELAENVVRLISDRSLRIRIAEGGHTHVQQFQWCRSVDQMEHCFESAQVGDST